MGEPHLRPNGSLVVQRLTSDVWSGLVLGGRRWWGLEAAWKRKGVGNMEVKENCIVKIIVRICFTVDCFDLFNVDCLVTGFPINQIGGSWSFTSPAWHLDGFWSAKSWWMWNNSVEKKIIPPSLRKTQSLQSIDSFDGLIPHLYFTFSHWLVWKHVVGLGYHSGFWSKTTQPWQPDKQSRGGAQLHFKRTE